MTIGIIVVAFLLLAVPSGWILWGLGYQRGKIDGIAGILVGAAVDRCAGCGGMVRAFWPCRIWNSDRVLCMTCFDTAPEEKPNVH